jgi:hypothetical protein
MTAATIGLDGFDFRMLDKGSIPEHIEPRAKPLQLKAPISGAFIEPSNGLEPLILSLPCARGRPRAPLEVDLLHYGYRKRDVTLDAEGLSDPELVEQDVEAAVVLVVPDTRRC